MWRGVCGVVGFHRHCCGEGDGNIDVGNDSDQINVVIIVVGC